MQEPDFDGDQMQCSYCGKWIYADVARCPKCGEYTDGLGTFQHPEKGGRPLSRVFVIAGWLALLAFLAPVLIVLYHWLQGSPGR